VPPEAQARFEPAYFGLHVHNNGNQRNWPDIPIGSLRLWDAGVMWDGIEARPNQFDFGRLDMYVEWAGQRGIEVLLPLGVPPRWASARPDEAAPYGPGSAAEPGSLRTWRGYVRAVAERYRGRVAAYQVWNEATEKHFYSGSLDTLVALAQAAADEVRKADPAALLVAPSAVGLDDRVAWPGRFLRQGGRGAVDAIAFHLYHSGQPPENIVAPVQRLLTLAAAAGGAALPLWNTESGYWMPNAADVWSADERRNQISEALAAAYLPRDLLLARALGVRRYHWYAWDGSKMGLLDPERPGAHRPAGAVYGQAIRALSGHTLERCERAAVGLWTCRMRAADGAALRALWVDPEAAQQVQEATVPAGGRTMVLDGRADWTPGAERVRASAVVTLWRAGS
jgi:Cellulase (glycosyl hydrolase family 5)